MKKLFYRLFGIKRYFIVFHQFATNDGNKYTGRIGIISSDGSYLDAIQFAKILQFKNDEIDIDIHSIGILNIIELNKSDYNDFNNK